MSPGPALMTTEEYFRTPESVGPEELIYGAWRAAEAPTPRHQSIVFAFGVAIDRVANWFASGRVYLAPVDVVLDAGRHLVVQPDLVFISQARIGIVNERIWGPPDLAVEVLSPRPRIGELRERLGWFASYGVRECWLVHQDQRIVEVIEFAGRRERVRRVYRSHERMASAVLPRFALSFDNVMERSLV